MKIALRLASLIAVLVIFYFSYYLLYFKAHSEIIASEEVKKYCAEHGDDFSKLTGPDFSHTLGFREYNFLGCDIHPAVYGWNKKSDKGAKNELAIIVWFDAFYGSHCIVYDVPIPPVWKMHP